MEKQIPKLSIITVNFNNKDGLIDTAKSVVAQTWIDYEWIIIDGGSTDGSVDVIKEYADKTDKLVYWCSEPDGGIYQGMNKGIERANGEYCWFLNSGDYAYKDTILAEIFANEFDEDIVYGNIKTIYPAELEIKYIDSIKDVQKNNPYRPTDWINCAVIKHQASFTKRHLFVSLGLYNTSSYAISADTEFFVKSIFRYSAKIKYINTIFAAFICDGISSNTEKQEIVRSEYAKIILENFPNSHEKMFVKSYIRKKINFIFLPFNQLKCAVVRVKKFGFSRTADYYKMKFICKKKDRC